MKHTPLAAKPALAHNVHPKPAAKTQPAQIQTAPTSRLPTSSEGMLRLQRTLGNRAVQRLMGHKPQSPQVGAEGGQAPEDVQTAIHQAQGGGKQVDSKVSSQLSRSLSTDVSQARVHTDARSEQITQSLGAQAATVGNDIFFSKGAYSPHTAGGQNLLAHELTHVAQQGSGSQKVQTSLNVGPAHDPYEQQAETVSRQFTNKQPVSIKPAQLGRIQRQMVFNFTTDAGTALFEHDKAFKKIITAYKAYARTPATEYMDVIFRLIEIKAFCKDYLDTYTGKSKKKDANAQNLIFSVDTELTIQRTHARNEFKKYRAGTKDGKSKQNWARQLDGKVRADKAKYKATIQAGLPPEMQKLTAGELKAIRIYTDEAFTVINPVTSNDAGWIGNMSENKKEFGKKVGQMAHVGLLNMPPTPWTSGGVLYKGESVSAKEGPELGKSVRTRKYPQFLSTSTNYKVAKDFAIKSAKENGDTRPYAIVSSIGYWKTARDIAAISVNDSEKEMLFPPNTSFSILSVTSNATEDGVEVKELVTRED